MLSTEEATATTPISLPSEHAVKFFVEDADLYETLAGYVHHAIDGGQAVLIAATREHWKGLELHLSSHDLVIEELVESGQLTFLDAEEAREELMVKGQPSEERFEAMFTARIEQLRHQWPGVYVYDEVVDMLAGDSQFGPMRQLEEMWASARLETGFGLMNGYRLASFGEAADEQPFENVCRVHPKVYAAGQNGGAEVARWQRRTFVLNNRLEEKQQALDEARAEIERERARNGRKDQFVGKFAHELRNPLAPVLSAVEMMNLRGDATTERERGIIERQVSRLVDLVDDFVQISRVMFGRAEMEQERVETHRILEQAIEQAQPSIEEGEHELHVDIARSELPVNADAHRLAQAVAHMLENAANYTPEGGNIWLRARREAGSVAISVRDDGTGVAPALLAEVFEMFVQDQSSAQLKKGGLGMGLALVRKIAEGHDGAVAAYSDGKGQGSEFVMRLPLAKPAHRQPKVSRLRDGEVAAGGRVLVVDDNADFAAMLSETLDLLGHDVRLAHDANDALATLGEFWPDVALLDINLPGMTGHELAEKLNAQASARGDLRLVAVTGYSDERKRKRSEEMGFDAHLVKPIVLSQLQETLDSVLEEQ